jgi:uncharacterized membrane protein
MAIDLIVLTATILLTSLSTGVFFGYATSVNWALGKLKDRDYVRTMQYIDEVIQNPLFLGAFMLPLALLPYVTFTYGGEYASLKFLLFAGASLAYILGMFGITMFGNVPMNDRLAKVAVNNASDADIHAARAKYEKPWNRLHTLRTWAGIISVVLLVCAAFI